MYRYIFALLLLSACHASQKTPVKHPPKRPSTTQTKPSKPNVPQTGQDERPTLPADDGTAAIAWVNSERLMPVLEEAGRLKKPVFLVFHASWCAPCKVMEEEIFNKPGAYEFLNQNCLSFHTDFDTEAGQTIAGVYEVKQLPTVLFLDPNGVEISRYKGIISVAEIQRLGKLAVEKVRN